MTDSAELGGLLERVRAAEGADRGLDATIWLRFTPGARRESLQVNHPKGAYEIDETRDATGRLVTVPAYSSSLDAAIGLVERVRPGWIIGIEIEPEHAYAEVRYARRKWFKAEATTPALALLEALLASLQEGQPHG